MSSETILILIASYRDPELKNTIESCLQNANQPNRIHFGICHQYDSDTFALLEKWRHDKRFKIIEILWSKGQGVGYARHLCNSLYKNEQFCMQIDSHMRFVQGWDDNVCDQWFDIQQQTGSITHALTEYPAPWYYITDEEERQIETHGEWFSSCLVFQEFNHEFVPTFKAHPIPRRDDDNNPLFRCRFAAGGFLFGFGDLLCKIPYDPDVCFTGEEILLSYRLFKAGIDLFPPTSPIVWHLYERPSAVRFWSVQSNYAELLSKSLDRLNLLLRQDKENVDEFENFTGICFAQAITHPRASLPIPGPIAYTSTWKQLKI